MSNDAGRYLEPPLSAWRNLAMYGEVLQRDFIRPLEIQSERYGGISGEMQVDVLRRLHWYFTVDMRERAPTVTLTADRAGVFHELVHRIMNYIDPVTVGEIDDPAITLEVRHALYSYCGLRRCSPGLVDAYDRDQGLFRLTYYILGELPNETFLVDGREVTPPYKKYRGCRFFHRLCMRQRIVWLPAGPGGTISLNLDGKQHLLILEGGKNSHGTARQPADTLPLEVIRTCGLPGRLEVPKPPMGIRRWKAQILKRLAALWPVRKCFGNAWIFVDREENADDNAEHIYRWVRENHPEINAWFLLNRTSGDWRRLKRDGFRLMPHGILRKLLILNSRHIISSHADYVSGGLDRALYGDMMHWRYTFLQHGIAEKDISHWLGPRQFDCMLTSSPAEYASIVGDDSGYPYTEREVKLTGLPRHDRLLRLASTLAPENRVLIMPTWRGGVYEEQTVGVSLEEKRRIYAESEYVMKWRAILQNPVLHALLERNGKRLAFMPHMNALPLLDLFAPPPCVEVIRVVDSSIQKVLAGSEVLVTDYSSIAFDFALLRRPIFYYQFDRDFFYGGGHNWRKGYFDYERDGFGPVASTENELLEALDEFYMSGGVVQYGNRMISAMPLNDEMACSRAFDSISALSERFGLQKG